MECPNCWKPIEGSKTVCNDCAEKRKEECMQIRCAVCGWLGKPDDLFTGKNPFNQGQVISGCPLCKAINSCSSVEAKGEITKDQRLEQLTQALRNVISLTNSFTPFQNQHASLVNAKEVLSIYGSIT